MPTSAQIVAQINETIDGFKPYEPIRPLFWFPEGDAFILSAQDAGDGIELYVQLVVGKTLVLSTIIVTQERALAIFKRLRRELYFPTADMKERMDVVCKINQKKNRNVL